MAGLCYHVCKCCKAVSTCRCCIPSQVVRIHCKANPQYQIAIREEVGAGTCIVSADDEDDSQLWIKDDKMAWNFDKEGGFSLVHKDTRKAIRATTEIGKQVLLADYDPHKLDESVIWYESKNKGKNYHTIYNGNPEIVLHALRCMKCDQLEPCQVEGEQRIKENTLVCVMKDKTKPDDPAAIALNQLWKFVPAKRFC